jgi:UTP:GlnB (protein PII) uridylyltransferase
MGHLIFSKNEYGTIQGGGFALKSPVRSPERSASVPVSLPFMPTIDVENGFTPGTGPPDEVVHTFFRRFLPDFYFVNAPISRMRRHLALIRQLPERPVIVDFHRPPGAHFTELTLCAQDDVEPGLLSKVAGTLTALKINVHTAWIHTLADPHQPQSGRRVVLDTLILSEPYFARARPLPLKTQHRVSAALTQVLSGEKNLGQLMLKTMRRIQGPLQVHDLSASRTGDDYTLIKLRAADDNGVLYRVTGALAALHLDVAHAQINTFEKAIDDVFFVLDAQGQPLSEEETAQKLEQLRRMLESETVLVDSR